jgi:broad specificity phosphatase PhoE
MKKLFFVRHGLTEMNVNGIISGQSETSLTEEGIEQAKQAGRTIKSKLPKIDLIICSPYERTRHTAEHIANEIGYPLNKIQQHDIFIERNFGPLEGKNGDDFFEKNEYKDIDTLEGAEKIEDLDKRAAKALAYVSTLQEDNILVVGHGSFGRAIRRAVHGLPHTHEYEVYTPIGNAEIIELV